MLSFTIGLLTVIWLCLWGPVVLCYAVLRGAVSFFKEVGDDVRRQPKRLINPTLDEWSD